MILVAGESLVDLLIRPDGSIYPSPGGGPFNAARTMSRLGQPTRFLGHFSADPFGGRLADRLRQDKVEITLADPVPEPTALATVALSGGGAPQYWFHLVGTAGFQLDRPAAQQALAAGISALHIGTLGLVVEPMAAEIEQLVTELPESALLLLDPNCRPGATPDADAYRARIKRILPRTDIVKTSIEDLEFLVPQASVADAAHLLLDWGAGCVLVTHGPDPVEAFGRDYRGHARGRQRAEPLVPPLRLLEDLCGPLC